MSDGPLYLNEIFISLGKGKKKHTVVFWRIVLLNVCLSLC